MDVSKKFLLLAVGFLTAIILIAQAVAPPEYHWATMSVSALAAQYYEHQWIMKMGFYGFGGSMMMIMAFRLIKVRKLRLLELLMFYYGIAVLLSGYFDARPFIAGVVFSEREGLAHSFIATIAGILFTAAILVSMLTEKNRHVRYIHFFFLAAVPVVSLLFGLAIYGYIDVGKGILQRLLYVVSFTWLLLYFPGEDR